MNKMGGICMFALGAAVGSAAAWRYAKKIYEQQAEEEIESVKEAFSRKPTVRENEGNPAGDESEEETDGSHYAKIIEREKYATDDESPVAEDGPYIISPDEFGEFEDYDQISLTYYADQVLADENNEEVENVDDVVGSESLTRFGEYEDDSVFVRNDRLKCDFEILMDARDYSSILKQRPNRQGG